MNSKHVLVVQCVRCCTLRTFCTNSCRSIFAQLFGGAEDVVEGSLHGTNVVGVGRSLHDTNVVGGSLHGPNVVGGGSLHATNAGVAARSKLARLENFFDAIHFSGRFSF